MERFLAAHASNPLWREAADQCLAELGDIPPEANLGFVYATDEWADELPTLVRYLQSRTGIEHWAGTVGPGICATGIEYHGVPALSVMLADLPDHGYRMYRSGAEDLDRLRHDHGGWYGAGARHVAVVHADPRNAQTPQLISALAEELPGGYLVGGLTATRGRAHPQVADEVVDQGLSGVLLSDDITVVTGLTQGCTPIGPAHEVTRSDHNVLVELDGRPALEVFNEDIGELLARDLNRVAGYIFAGLPVSEDPSADYLVRNLIGVDSKKKLVGIGAPVEEGQRLMFCRRDGNSAREDLKRMLDDIVARAGRPPRGALYFSCVGRGAELFGENSDELRLIHESLGEVPLSGFFCNGEICGDRLYGYTGVLTLFL